MMESPQGQQSAGFALSAQGPRPGPSGGAQPFESVSPNAGTGTETFNMSAIGAALSGVRQSPPGFTSTAGAHGYAHGQISHPSHLQQHPLQHAGLAAFSSPHQDPQLLQYITSHSPAPQGVLASPPFIGQTGPMHRSGHGSPTQSAFSSALPPGPQLPSPSMMYYPQAFGAPGAIPQNYQGSSHAHLFHSVELTIPDEQGRTVIRPGLLGSAPASIQGPGLVLKVCRQR